MHVNKLLICFMHGMYVLAGFIVSRAGGFSKQAVTVREAVARSE